jgi:AraC-like DNA-binding protein
MKTRSGKSYLLWRPAPGFSVFAFWGRLQADELPALLAHYDAIAATQKSFDLVTDVSRLDAVERPAFDLLARYVEERMPARGRQIRRHAFIRPKGFIGAVSAGFHALIAPPYDWRDCASLVDAFTWLERREDPTKVAEMIDALAAASPTLQALQRYLAAHLQRPSVRGAARALHTSERSLQRQLAARGTHFRRQLAEARVEMAKTLLAEGEDKIDVIARRVGCSSASNLGALFRRETGQTPSQYRLAQRQ